MNKLQCKNNSVSTGEAEHVRSNKQTTIRINVGTGSTEPVMKFQNRF